MRRQTASELAAGSIAGRWIGIALMLITGPLMFSADAVRYHYNPSFQFKMICLMLALLFHFTLHRRAVRSDASPLLAASWRGAISLAALDRRGRRRTE